MNKRGFTIMEVIIAIVLLGLVSAFAVPNYGRAIRKSAERSAIAQLTGIYATARLVNDATGRYPNSGGAQDETWINNNLDLNITERDVQITYNGSNTAFTATAVLSTGASIRMTQIDIDPTNATANLRNPCCTNTACLVALSCT